MSNTIDGRKMYYVVMKIYNDPKHVPHPVQIYETESDAKIYVDASKIYVDPSIGYGHQLINSYAIIMVPFNAHSSVYDTNWGGYSHD